MKFSSPLSPTGWWVAALLERHNDPKGTFFWNNYRLVRADHWRDAFAKARAFGLRDSESRSLGYSTEFLGVTDLLPIYDPFEDGAEIMFEKYTVETGEDAEAPCGTYSEDEMAALYEPESAAAVDEAAQS